MASNPTKRTLAECRRLGWVADVVERWVGPHGARGVRKDLFGFLDILALTPDGVLGIQACAGAGGDVQRRVRKIQASPNLKPWLDTGARCEVWGWRKLKGRGRRQWWPRRMRVHAERVVDLDAVEALL